MRPIIDDAFIAMLESRELCVHNPMNGLFGGSRRSRAYGSSTEFADYREYEPGDDLRRVDWNLCARLEKMYLKLFVDEKQPKLDGMTLPFKLKHHGNFSLLVSVSDKPKGRIRSLGINKRTELNLGG